jgi:hypothetical protein
VPVLPVLPVPVSSLFKLVETGGFSKQLEAAKALGDYKITSSSSGCRTRR